MDEEIRTMIEKELDGESSYIHVMIHSNMGIKELENWGSRLLEDLELDIERTERVWTASSPRGAVAFYTNRKVIVISWILADESDLISVVSTDEDPLDDMYDEMGDSLSSGVMRVFNDKMG